MSSVRFQSTVIYQGLVAAPRPTRGAHIGSCEHAHAHVRAMTTVHTPGFPCFARDGCALYFAGGEHGHAVHRRRTGLRAHPYGAQRVAGHTHAKHSRVRAYLGGHSAHDASPAATARRRGVLPGRPHGVHVCVLPHSHAAFRAWPAATAGRHCMDDRSISS